MGLRVGVGVVLEGVRRQPNSLLHRGAFRFALSFGCAGVRVLCVGAGGTA
jgi:hypothetical protein